MSLAKQGGKCRYQNKWQTHSPKWKIGKNNRRQWTRSLDSEHGRPAKHSRREILNGIFYVTRSGCAWHLLPHDLPAWRTVYHYFWLWHRKGIWQQMHDKLRELVRLAVGRNPEPSAAILDSQSVKTTEQGGVRGYDGGKLVNGRKHQVLVDTMDCC